MKKKRSCSVSDKQMIFELMTFRLRVTYVSLGFWISGVSASGETLSKLHSLVDDYSIHKALKDLLSPHIGSK